MHFVAKANGLELIWCNLGTLPNLKNYLTLI